jgi:hypothetical protein
MSDEKKKFKLARKKELFDVELEDGSTKEYAMREMDGALRSSYMDVLGKRSKFNALGKSAGLTDYKNLEAALLTKCVVDPESGKFVEEKEINSWASSAVSDIFDWALKFNGLDKDAEKDAKNDSGASDESGTT